MHTHNGVVALAGTGRDTNIPLHEGEQHRLRALTLSMGRHAPTCGSGFPACYPARAPILLRILTLPCISAPPLLLASPMTSPTDSRRLLPIFCSMLHKQQPCRHYTACAGSACPGSCPRAATMPATRPSPSAEADQRRGFAAAHGSLNFYPFQSSDMTRMLCVVNSSHYLPLSGLGALRACCLPWM